MQQRLSYEHNLKRWFYPVHIKSNENSYCKIIYISLWKTYGERCCKTEIWEIKKIWLFCFCFFDKSMNIFTPFCLEDIRSCGLLSLQTYLLKNAFFIKVFRRKT